MHPEVSEIIPLIALAIGVLVVVKKRVPNVVHWGVRRTAAELDVIP